MKSTTLKQLLDGFLRYGDAYAVEERQVAFDFECLFPTAARIMSRKPHSGTSRGACQTGHRLWRLHLTANHSSRSSLCNSLPRATLLRAEAHDQRHCVVDGWFSVSDGGECYSRADLTLAAAPFWRIWCFIHGLCLIRLIVSINRLFDGSHRMTLTVADKVCGC